MTAASKWARMALGVVLLGGLAFLVFPPRPAEADLSSEKTAKLVKYLGSKAPLNLKLLALEILRQRSGTETDLSKLARGSDVKLAIFATTALGRKKTSAAKEKLKGLLDLASLSTHVRVGAMTAIAVHFKDPGDLSFLESRSRNDATLKARYLWLRSEVYQR